MNLSKKIKGLLLKALKKEGFDRQNIIAYIQEFLNANELKLVTGFLGSINNRSYTKDTIESLWKKFIERRNNKKKEIIEDDKSNGTVQQYIVKVGANCGKCKYHINLILPAKDGSEAFDIAENIIQDWYFSINEVKKKFLIERINTSNKIINSNGGN